MMQTFLRAATVLVFAYGLQIPANAGLIPFVTRASFEAIGSNFQNSNFDDFIMTANIGDPFVRGGLSYDQSPGENRIIAGILPNTQSLLVHSATTPFQGQIVSKLTYNLFGFDAGLLFDSGDTRVTLQISTNLANYQFPNLAPSNVPGVLSFYGFATDNSMEFFDNFSFIRTAGVGGPGITNVSIGTTAVPEPTSLVTFAIGSCLFGLRSFRRGRRKSKDASVVA